MLGLHDNHDCKSEFGSSLQILLYLKLAREQTAEHHLLCLCLEAFSCLSLHSHKTMCRTGMIMVSRALCLNTPKGTVNVIYCHRK